MIGMVRVCCSIAAVVEVLWDKSFLGPAELLESIPKRGDEGLTFRVVLGIAHQHPDAPHLVALLRTRRKRPYRCAAQKRDESAPLHCPSQAEEPIVTGQTGMLEVVRLALGNVRFGSKADIAALPINVRFTPESGHRNSTAKCPLAIEMARIPAPHRA